MVAARRTFFEKIHLFKYTFFVSGERLAITLRFLATGASYKTLEYSFLVGSSTICKIIPDTLKAIIAGFGHVIHMPDSPEEWKAVAQRFGDRQVILKHLLS